MPAWYDQIKPKFVSNVANIYAAEAGITAFDLFPKVNSKQISGYIAKYSKKDWARIGDLNDYKRQGATESAGDDFTVTSQAYTLDEFAFHKDISKDDRNEYDNPFDPVKDATRFVLHRLNRILLQNLVSNLLTSGVWGTDHDENSSTWDSKTSGESDVDPVEKVMTWHQEIESVTGFKANRIVMSPDVYYACKLNTHITARMKTTSDKVVTTDLLGRLFEVEKLYVLNAVNSDSDDYMWSGGLLLYYAPPRASKFEPSAAYNITYKGNDGNVLTRTIPMPWRNDALRIEAAIKTKPLVVAADLGVYAYNLVS